MSVPVYSTLESKRFGRLIFRGNMDKMDVEVLRQVIAAHDPDTIIVRMPVSEQWKMSALNELGREVIFADTLVYYQVDLEQTTFGRLRDGEGELRFEVADVSKEAVVDDLIARIFKNYTNHYFSNPLLNREKIVDGYEEWAGNVIREPGNLSVLVYSGGEPVGFIICSRMGDTAEIILNGVLPQEEGKGIYTQLVRFVKQHFHEQGVKYLKVSTQIQNFAVQKVWDREGMSLSAAFVTVHLNKRGG